MALVRCILGKFLGVVCHCFPRFSLYNIKNINRFVFVMEGTVFFVRYTLNPYMLITWLPHVSAVAWLRRSAAGLSTIPGEMIFVVHKVALWHVSFSPSTSVSTVRIVPPVIHNHHLRPVLSKGQAGGSLGGFEENIALPSVGEDWIGKSRGLALVQNIAYLYTLLFAYQTVTQSPVNPANYCPISRTVPFHIVTP
jgi:hypothetical protein